MIACGEIGPTDLVRLARAGAWACRQADRTITWQFYQASVSCNRRSKIQFLFSATQLKFAGAGPYRPAPSRSIVCTIYFVSKKTPFSQLNTWVASPQEIWKPSLPFVPRATTT